MEKYKPQFSMTPKIWKRKKALMGIIKKKTLTGIVYFATKIITIVCSSQANSFGLKSDDN